jgi:hypothetical protein
MRPHSEPQFLLDAAFGQECNPNIRFDQSLLVGCGKLAGYQVGKSHWRTSEDKTILAAVSFKVSLLGPRCSGTVLAGPCSVSAHSEFYRSLQLCHNILGRLRVRGRATVAFPTSVINAHSNYPRPRIMRKV